MSQRKLGSRLDKLSDFQLAMEMALVVEGYMRGQLNEQEVWTAYRAIHEEANIRKHGLN